MSRSTTIGWAVLLVGISPTAVALSFNITDLGTLGGGSSEGFGVNSRGQVVGWSSTEAGGVHGFLYGDRGLVDLGAPAGGRSVGHDINDRGYVVATKTDYADSSLEMEAVVLDGWSTRGLGTLGGTMSMASAINNRGDVTGASATTDGETHAFIHDGTTMRDLGTLGGSYSHGSGINNWGQVTGQSTMAGDTGHHAFLYDGAEMIDLGTLGGSGSWGHDVNDRGQVTGISGTAGGEHHAFLYDGTRMLDLGVLDGTTFSFGHGINTRGQVVGRSGDLDPIAFLYDMRLGGMVDLNEYIDPASGWTLEVAYDISSNGYITGYGTRDGRRRAFLLTPIPEPATMVLLGMGLAALALQSLRKKPQF